MGDGKDYRTGHASVLDPTATAVAPALKGHLKGCGVETRRGIFSDDPLSEGKGGKRMEEG